MGRVRRDLTTAFVLLGLVTLCPPAHAAKNPAKKALNKFEVYLGGFYANVDTNIRLDGTGGMVGVEVDFENNLGLDDSEATPIVALDFHISRKHGLNLTYFKLDRSAFSASTVTFRFGEITIDVGVPVSTTFNTEVIALSYTYSFLRNEKRSFGLLAGLNVNDIATGIVTEDMSMSEDADVTAPLPTLGLFGGAALGGKWVFYGKIGVFALSFDDYDGSIVSLNSGFFHHTFKNVGFGVGYDAFLVNVDSENEDFLGKIKYGYHGPVVYLKLRF